MTSKDLEDTEIIDQLASLQSVQERDPRRAANRRRLFLAEAEQLKSTVSKPALFRLITWKGLFYPIKLRPRREGVSMLNIVMLIALGFGVVFGGSGITVAAAQGSMPDDVLYPVKLLSEQVRLRIAEDASEEAQLATEFANRRVEEIRTMLQTGMVPDETVVVRLQEQLETCLMLAVRLSQPESVNVLVQLQEQLRVQTQDIAHTNMPDTAELQQIRDRVLQTLELHLHLTEMGVSDPLKLKEELQLREQDRLNQQGDDSQYQQNQYQNFNGRGSEPSPFGSNPWTTGTPTQGSEYGPGEPQNPWIDVTPTPGSGYGSGESQNPWIDVTPTPGSGYGPESRLDPSCTPQSGTQTGSGSSTSTGGNSPTDTGGNWGKP